MQNNFRGEHILIVGFSRTGLAAANFLFAKGAVVYISDTKPLEQLKDSFSELEGEPEKMYCGKQELEQLNGIHKVVLSPGVPRTIPLIKKAQEQNIPVLSEIELAYRHLPKDVKIIGITGTDGKTTTTNIISEMLKTTYTVYTGGNIGTPFLSFLDKVKSGDFVVLELSSYQLEHNETFKCDTACILNISQDHLDRYPGFDDYISAKENILKTQDKNSVSILNKDSGYFSRHKKFVKGNLISFSLTDKKSNAFIDNNNIVYNSSNICHTNIIKIQGVHNLENILCAVAVAKQYNVENKDIISVLETFSGLEHRNEFVDNINGIDFINDSKATTVNSVKKAIQSQNKPIILLLGGRDKGLDFSELNSLIDEKVKHVVLFGEAMQKIASQLNRTGNIDMVSEFELAVQTAYKRSISGDVVLLSPGCTSWDAFKSYEHRGKVFKKIVRGLK